MLTFSTEGDRFQNGSQGLFALQPSCPFVTAVHGVRAGPTLVSNQREHSERAGMSLV